MPPVMPGYRLVSIDASRAEEVLELTTWAFPDVLRREDAPILATNLPVARSRAMEITDADLGEVGSLAGHAASYTFRMRVPGGAKVPVAGLTWVGVHPGHRRRGLLRELMADHLADARARGEVASVLYASESVIYQRFGYGLAALEANLTLGRGADLRPVDGSDRLTVRIESADVARHGAIMADLQSRLDRPGTMTLQEDELAARFSDPSNHQQGSERMRFIVIEDPDAGPVAYAQFRRSDKWDERAVPEGEVNVWAHAALTPAATHRLWSVMLDLDLMGSVKVHPVAPDDALVRMLVDPRGARMNVKDNLWLRIVDVPAALAAREYLCPVDAVIQVTDALFPDNAGPWRVTSRDGTGHVEAAPDAEPDLVLDVAHLGAAYLGGVSLVSLAAAGLIDERSAGAVRGLAAAFEATQAPVCNVYF